MKLGFVDVLYFGTIAALMTFAIERNEATRDAELLDAIRLQTQVLREIAESCKETSE